MLVVLTGWHPFRPQTQVLYLTIRIPTSPTGICPDRALSLSHNEVRALRLPRDPGMEPESSLAERTSSSSLLRFPSSGDSWGSFVDTSSHRPWDLALTPRKLAPEMVTISHAPCSSPFSLLNEPLLKGGVARKFIQALNTGTKEVKRCQSKPCQSR